MPLASRPIRMRRALALYFALAAASLTPSIGLAAELSVGNPRPRDILTAGQLRLALEKLQVMGSALYIAAHPDDENTSLLSYLASGRKVRAAYLSLTRGDGGQNLIGTEIGEELGVIRTQELLAARRIDGAEQYFTRALDFGYSKTPDETQALWGRDRTLADVVWVIRRFRPDVIITRFPPDGGGGHGHHTASSILAEEAFAAAADSTRFPEQLRSVRPWRAKRLVWNVFRFGGSGPDTSRTRLRIDLGSFSPLLGRSYTEIAGESRSMHKSQGFGSAERRGAWENTFEHRLGERAAKDLFEGVDLGWSRIPGGARVGALLAEAAKSFDPARPAAILPALARAHAAMAALPRDSLVETKERELMEVMRSCAGLWIEADAASPAAVPGSKLRVTITALNRSDAPVALERIELPYGAVARLAGAPKANPEAPEAAGVPLPANQTVTAEAVLALPADLPISQPYWLKQRALASSFQVDEPSLIGEPESPAAVTARAIVNVAGERLAFRAPLVYRWVDPVEGERYRSFAIVPPVTCRFDRGVYLFPDAAPREIRVVVECADSSLDGTARLRLPTGWKSEPAEVAVKLSGAGSERAVRFMVTPASSPASAAVAAEVETRGARHSYRRVVIDHEHIPIQTLFPPAEARLVRADVRHRGDQIAYLMGSGDQVPEALRQMGFHVTLLSDEEVESMDLAHFDAIVAGVRAYNTRKRLRALQSRLLDYVSRGGRLVLQYDTADEALNDALGPFPFKISRDRVAVEGAEMRILKPAHPLLTAPNKITAEDFAGWVQERGLYYANPWDPRYETVFSANDPGETAKDGGLLFARHGRGVFIYTGLSWFRQLPAGVPGAYRLFANLVSPEPRR